MSGAGLSEKPLPDFLDEPEKPQPLPQPDQHFGVLTCQVVNLSLPVGGSLPDHFGDLFGGRPVGVFRKGLHGLLDQSLIRRVPGQGQGTAGKVCSNPSRGHGLGQDPEGSQFEGQAFVLAFQSPLCCMVDRIERESDVAPDGCDRHEGPGPVLPEMGNKRLGHPEYSEQIGVDLPALFLIGCSFEGTCQSVSRIVQDHIDGMGLQDSFDGLSDLSRVGDIKGKDGDPRLSFQLGCRSRIAHGSQYGPTPRKPR